MLTCKCEIGQSVCPEAMQLWRAYTAAREIHAALRAASEENEHDPIMHDRARLAHAVKIKARVAYEAHVSGESEPVPEPQSLRAERHLRPVS